jgi:hypothetical protein
MFAYNSPALEIILHNIAKFDLLEFTVEFACGWNKKEAWQVCFLVRCWVHWG